MISSLQGINESHPIEMVDSSLETSVNLTALLKFIINHTKLSSLDPSQIEPIVKLMKKYDLTRELQVLRWQVQEATRDYPKWDFFTTFVAAAWLEDHSLGAKVIEIVSITNWEKRQCGRADGPCLDLRTWSEADLACLPPRVLWALLRASRNVNWLCRDDVDEMAEIYESIIAIDSSVSCSFRERYSADFSVLRID